MRVDGLRNEKPDGDGGGNWKPNVQVSYSLLSRPKFSVKGDLDVESGKGMMMALWQGEMWSLDNGKMDAYRLQETVERGFGNGDQPTVFFGLCLQYYGRNEGWDGVCTIREDDHRAVWEFEVIVQSWFFRLTRS